MAFTDYERIQAVNFSSLKAIAKSPAHYRHNLLNKRGDTDHFRLGRAVHVAVLQPELFASEFAVWPAENGRRYGKKWDAFVETHGENILKEDEQELCLAMQAAVRSNPTAAKYLTGGVAEQSVVWTDPETKLPCKARPDYRKEAKVVVDLKTTRDASPTAFGRECYRFNYHCQGAFYSDGVAETNGGQVPQFVIIAVEKDPPHIVQVYHLPEITMEVGRAQVREWMDLLAKCRATDVWPAYADGEVELLLPSWAVADDEDEDMSGLDLVVG